MRVGTPFGLSNPRVFCVGQLPEVSKTEWRSIPQSRSGRDPASTPAAEVRVTLPTTINGQIAPGGEDRYRFQASAGSRSLPAVSARELIPYLADAVPGWFQAVLTIYDAQGNELAHDDDTRVHPDPVLFYRIPGTANT